MTRLTSMMKPHRAGTHWPCLWVIHICVCQRFSPAKRRPWSPWRTCHSLMVSWQNQLPVGECEANKEKWWENEETMQVICTNICNRCLSYINIYIYIYVFLLLYQCKQQERIAPLLQNCATVDTSSLSRSAISSPIMQQVEKVSCLNYEHSSGHPRQL